VAAFSSTPAVPPLQWRRAGVLLFSVAWGANHFAPLLSVYRKALALDAAAPALLLGVYAVGLVPGLLIAGPLSDRLGRRALLRPAAIGAVCVSLWLALLGTSFPMVLLGRFFYGLAAGAAMSPGAVWVAELSREAAAGVGARRATIALSGGFGFGPLVSGALAQWAPAPMVTPYLVHVSVLSLALLLAWTTHDTRPAHAPGGPLLRLELSAEARRRFLREVLPMAPFVFGFCTLAFAGLPSLVLTGQGGAPLATTGLLTALTLFTGVAAQPFTRRFTPELGCRLGLLLGAVGLLVGALAAATGWSALLWLAAPPLGGAYGVCMTSGLRMLEGLAPPQSRGGLTGVYYVLTYVGFGAPWLLAMLNRVLPAVPVLLALALHASLTAAWLALGARRPA
jgi:MFS family permease